MDSGPAGKILTAGRLHRSRAWLPALPWVTATFVLIAGLAGLTARLAGALHYDRARVAAGAFWLPFTAQFVHWTPRMALADLGTTLLVGSALESRSRPLLVAAFILSFLCVGMGLPLLVPDLSVYRGASGLTSGLFVALALDLTLEPRGREAARDRLRRFFGALAFVLFASKTAVEMATGAAIFAGDLGPGVRVLPSAHLLGAVAGALAAIGRMVGRWGRRGEWVDAGGGDPSGARSDHHAEQGPHSG
jgi:rhomboid family GlyGly-CTERM serine protease